MELRLPAALALLTAKSTGGSCCLELLPSGLFGAGSPGWRKLLEQVRVKTLFFPVKSPECHTSLSCRRGCLKRKPNTPTSTPCREVPAQWATREAELEIRRLGRDGAWREGGTRDGERGEAAASVGGPADESGPSRQEGATWQPSPYGSSPGTRLADYAGCLGKLAGTGRGKDATTADGEER